MMENKKAETLNSKAAREESKAKEVVAALRLKKGMRVADIGSGGGYFSLLLAEAVGAKGKVFMVDTNQKYLDFSMALAKEKGIANVKPVLANEGIPDLPEHKIDLIFMRNVCHHMKNRADYFSALKRLLAKGGRVALIDYSRGPFLRFRWLFGHYVERDAIRKEMLEAGFHLDESFDFIARQWFMIFSPLLSQESR
jgi:ubiquinone/menaquinone biosynthesis C-methylase UbiE